MTYNVIANFVGRSWSALLAVILVPVYLRYLGVEAYGLVGFFVSLQAVIGLLDLGLSTTANREIAMRSRAITLRTESRDLVRTLEVVYIGTAVCIALVFIAGADRVANQWINAEKLSPTTIQWAVVIFGVTLASRWPVALYSGVLQGSEKQVSYNCVSVAVSTLKHGGAAILVAWCARGLMAFLAWQLCVALLEVVVMAAAAWRALRPDTQHRPSFRVSLLRQVWGFSASVGTNSLLAAVLKQLDRILITKLLSLVEVGYYTTATTAHMGLALLTAPIAAVAFPRLTFLIAQKNEAVLGATYRKLARLVSFITAPAAAVMCFYSYDLLLLWTGSTDIASGAWLICSVLAVGNALNAMMQIPYMLQLAAGITRIALWINAIAVVLLTPLMYFLIARFGVTGAGIAWAIFNFLYYLIAPHIIHRYILAKYKWDWILKDTLPFLCLAWALFGASRALQQWYGAGELLTFAIVLGTGSVYLAACAALYASIRSTLCTVLFRRFGVAGRRGAAQIITTYAGRLVS